MAITQDQVNQWFTLNPNAAQDEMAAAVQSAGGLENNAGLAGMIANRFNVPEAGVNQYYQTYTNQQAPTGVTGGLNTLATNNLAGNTGAGLDTAIVNNTQAGAGLNALVPAQPVAQDLTTPFIPTTQVAPITGTPITGAATTATAVDPIFEWFRTHPNATDAEIAAQMRTEKWTPEMVAQSTGTMGQLANYENRYISGINAFDKAAADKAAADQQAAMDASSRASAEAALKASADAKARGVFQTVYDPRTGREFFSPAQAIQYGVTDYVTEMPMKLEFLNDTSKKAVTDAMAAGMTFEQALNRLGSKYGMSGKDFYNYEVQGGIRFKDTLPIQEAIKTESGGLKPDELIAKLQAYKDKPPTTAQEFAEQRALYADYANRYANSSWNYANMGGKAQDHSLKPKDYLGLNFTGYSEPINFALSNINQNSAEFKNLSKILTENPEINDIFDELYKLNPDAMVFNAINPKYAGGTEASMLASNFSNTVLKTLAENIQRLGKDTAIQQFIGQQQQMLFALPDDKGKVGNFNQATMANPEYRALNDLADKYTPTVSDAAWARRILGETRRGESVGSVYRDADTGKGLAIQYDQNGNPFGIRFINQQGAGGSVPMGDPAKLVEAAYQSGIPLSAFTQLAKTSGMNVIKPSDGSSYWPKGLESYTLDDLASGKVAKTIASDDWLKFMVADAKAKDSNPDNPQYAGGLNDQISKLKNQQKIAQDYLADAAKPKTKTTTTTVAEAPVGVTDQSSQGLKSLAAQAFGDQSLNDWEKTNKVMKAAQEAGVNDAGLQQIFGKDVADKYLGLYGAGLKDFVSKTLDKSEGTTFDEIATIKQEARKYNITPQEFAKYSGMDAKQADAMFGAYDTGLANLVKSWQKADADAGTDKDAQAKAAGDKIKTYLALEQQYGVTPEDMAKAYGGNVTAKDITDYLQPVKDAPQKIQSLIGDNTLSGADIRKTIDSLKSDSRIQGIYGAMLNKLSDAASQDYSGEYGGKKFESLNPIAVNNVLSQLKAQQDAGTAQYYQGGASSGKKGGFGSLDKVTEDMAKNLVAAGVTDIRQVGQKTITEKDEEGNDVTRTEIINKVTGEPISKFSNYSERTQGNAWSGTFAGPGNTGYNVQFKDGNPIFYTTGASSNSMQDFAPMLAMASLIPGAAPFVAGINALYAAQQGNTKGALLSALGAAGPLAGMAGASADTVANLGTASKIANVANAVSNKDLLGAVLSGTSLASDKNLMGENAFNANAKLAGDFSTKDLLTGASAVKAISDKDLASLASIGAQASGSKDAVLAAKGMALLNALKSDNPFAIASALQKMNLTQDVLGKASGGLAALPA